MTEKQYGFGRIPSPFDWRDYNLTAFMPKGILKETFINERKWDYPKEPLDQGSTPHCVGFSMANFGVNLPIFTNFENDDGHRFYYLCKIEDGEPNSENGSYVRSAAKVLKDNGHIRAYAFAHTIEDIKWWILNKGPMIVGTIWTQDMMTPDENGIIRITGPIVGGHAYLLNEWREDDYIGIQNSWGNEWGLNGKAYISKNDFEILFNFDGEAITSVEVIPGTTYPTKKRFLQMLLEWLRIVFKC